MFKTIHFYLKLKLNGTDFEQNEDNNENSQYNVIIL